MESMVTFPYLMPALRFRPDLAGEVARYALNAAANLRWSHRVPSRGRIKAAPIVDSVGSLRTALPCCHGKTP